jgi:D-alanine-D-alanine ligase
MSKLTKAVILINPESTGLHLIEAAKKFDFKPIAAYSFPFQDWITYQKSGELACPSYPVFQELIETIIFSEQLDELIAKLHNLPYEIVGVIPASEDAVNVSDIIASHFGLICNDPQTIPLRRNKLQMKIAARKHGLKTADFKLCFNQADLDEFMANNSFPFVLKTPEGLGTSDVYICKNPEDAIEAFNKICQSHGILGHKAKGALAESFIGGDEYAVNLFVHEDQIKVTDVWKYQKISNEFGDNIYYSAILIPNPEIIYENLMNYAIELTKAVGINYGPVHAEIKLSHDTPIMVEIASRLPGIHQPQMTVAFSNFNSIESTVAVYTGLPVVFPEKKVFKKQCGIVCGINNQKGIVRDIQGIEAIKQLPSYHDHSLSVGLGDKVNITTNLIELPLTVELAHENNEQILLDIDCVHQLFKLEMEEIIMLDKLPVPKSQICIWVFIPYKITDQGLISEYEHPSCHQELASVFAELDIKWKWQQITLKNMQAVVEEVFASNSDYTPVVLNYCDGFDEVDGYPGLSVIKLLEAKGITFTGADSNFEYLAISKIRTKQAFIEAGVSTAPYDVIYDINKIGGICERLGTPLIIKPAISNEGIGLSSKSIVSSDEEIFQYIKHLLDEEKGSRFTLGNIFVERFISGREFTVFILGSSHQPDQLKVYPSMERLFHSSVPETEQFLSYGYWERDDDESFISFELVNSELQAKLCELSKRAYCAVGGNGYGRVDVRMDQVSQELFVLEVNSNCLISSLSRLNISDNPLGSSVGTILYLAGIPFSQLMSEIIAGAWTRYSDKL